MAVAPTGTGKTAAFVIPIINQLLKSKRKGAGIRVLILVPTRELAKQIVDVIDLIAIKTGVSCLGLYGGVEQDSQITALEKRLDVLVTTPGRMFDLISQGFIKLDRIECFVIDEADLMLDLGFNRDIQDVLKFLPKRRQNLFFTATVNKKIKALAYDVVRMRLEYMFLLRIQYRRMYNMPYHLSKWMISDSFWKIYSKNFKMENSLFLFGQK